MSILSLLTMPSYNSKIKNHAAPIIWFLLVAIVVYAFFCTSKGYNFGVIANPLKVGCYR